jgi:hypothetical protein
VPTDQVPGLAASAPRSSWPGIYYERACGAWAGRLLEQIAAAVEWAAEPFDAREGEQRGATCAVDLTVELFSAKALTWVAGAEVPRWPQTIVDPYR